MNSRNEIVGTDAQGRKKSRRKLEHRHGNNWQRKILAKKAAKK